MLHRRQAFRNRGPLPFASPFDVTSKSWIAKSPRIFDGKGLHLSHNPLDHEAARTPKVFSADQSLDFLSLKPCVKHGSSDFTKATSYQCSEANENGKGWNRKLCRALVYTHADPLRDDIEMLKKKCP